MTKKSYTSVKEELSPLLTEYTKLLLDGLKEDQIIEEISNSQPKAYKVKSLKNKEVKEIDNLSPSTGELIQDFYDFRELVRHVYYNLGYGDTEKTNFTALMAEFERRQVFHVPGQSITRFKDIFDKGKNLIEDKEIQQDVIKLFIENKINFSSYTSQLLEFYTKEKAREHFPNFIFESDKRGPEGILKLADIVAKNKHAEEFDLIFEVKFRKRALSTLKENLFQAYEYLVKYNSVTKRDNCLILVIYTQESTSVLEKLDYRFKQYIQELFPDYLNRIFLIALYTGNVHLIVDEFSRVKSQLSQIASKKYDFRFFNQPPSKEHPEIDDHYLDRILNFESSNYLIKIQHKIAAAHWRFGIKFSASDAFPSQQIRHGVNYPIIHLEKNTDTKKLMISFYDESGNQASATKTRIDEYTSQVLLISIRKNRDKVVVDVQDERERSVVEKPLEVKEFFYGKLFAWADGKNPFEIWSIVEEFQYT